MAAEVVVPVIGVAALAGLGLLAYMSSGPSKPVKKAVSLAEACAQGTTDGDKDGAADTGGPKVQANYTLNVSDDPAVQAKYDECYHSAFDAKYVAPKVEPTGGGGGGPIAWKPPGPPSGLDNPMREGETAYTYGRRRGKGKATEDFNDGNDADPVSPLSTSGSLLRQKESGNPAEYQRGFKDGYVAQFTKLQTDKAIKEVLPTGADRNAAESGRRRKVGTGAARPAGGFVAWRPAYRPAFARAA